MMWRSLRTVGVILGVSLSLVACSTVDVSSAPAIRATDVVAVMPLANYTETPEAGRAAASIVYAVLRAQGHGAVVQDLAASQEDSLFGGADSGGLHKGLEWARKSGARFAVLGAVQEWRYKVGVDGEPTVGLSFTLIDLDSGKTAWAATGSRTGWSRSSVAGVAQTLIRSLLSSLRASTR